MSIPQLLRLGLALFFLQFSYLSAQCLQPSRVYRGGARTGCGIGQGLPALAWWSYDHDLDSVARIIPPQWAISGIASAIAMEARGKDLYALEHDGAFNSSQINTIRFVKMSNSFGPTFNQTALYDTTQQSGVRKTRLCAWSDNRYYSGLLAGNRYSIALDGDSLAYVTTGDGVYQIGTDQMQLLDSLHISDALDVEIVHDSALYILTGDSLCKATVDANGISNTYTVLHTNNFRYMMKMDADPTSRYLYIIARDANGSPAITAIPALIIVDLWTDQVVSQTLLDPVLPGSYACFTALNAAIVAVDTHSVYFCHRGSCTHNFPSMEWFGARIVQVDVTDKYNPFPSASNEERAFNEVVYLDIALDTANQHAYVSHANPQKGIRILEFDSALARIDSTNWQHTYYEFWGSCYGSVPITVQYEYDFQAGWISNTTNCGSVIFYDTFPDPSPITSYQWNFGDGTFSTLETPEHFYAAAGTYNVCLIAAEGCNADTICQMVTVGAHTPCLADFGFASTAFQVTFMDSSVAIPPITAYHWDFGDGAIDSVQNPDHIYAANGLYNVCLIVENECDADTVCQLVTIAVVGQEAMSPHSVHVQPNPSQGNFAVATLPAAAFSYELYNAQGQRVLQGNADDRAVLNCDCAPGLYFLAVKSGLLSSVKKVVVTQ